MLGAGHESTSNTLTWALQELSQQPEVQEKLRQEINDTWNKVRARGGTELSSTDLDKMEYTVAVIKVSLLLTVDCSMFNSILIGNPSLLSRLVLQPKRIHC